MNWFLAFRYTHSSFMSCMDIVVVNNTICNDTEDNIVQVSHKRAIN